MTLPRGASLVGLAVALLGVLPLVWLVLLAIDGGGERALETLRHPQVVPITMRTLVLAVAVALGCVAIALPTAWLTHATDLPGRRLFRGLTVLPLAIPSYVSGYVVVALLGPSGPLRAALGAAGVTLPSVEGPFGIGIALSFLYPLVLLPLQAALEGADPRQYEAARSLGRSPARAFVEVVLPQLRGAMAGGGLLVALYVVGDFGAVSLLRYPTLSYVIYLRYRSPFGRDDAVGFALLLAAVVLVLLVLHRLVEGASRARESRAMGRAWPVVSLGAWRWPALLWCSLVSLFGVVVPLGTLVYWIVRGSLAGAALSFPTRELLTTVGLGAVATLVITGLAIFPALLLRSGPRALGRVVQGATAAGYAMPGIVVALALVFFAIRLAEPLYQTFTLLVMAYSVRFLPLASQNVSAAVLAQSRRLDEAARSLGTPARAVARRVTVPAARPALVAGALAVFIAVVKELPVTLLLSPLDTQTLATRVFSQTSEAYFAAAAIPALLLVGASTLALVARPAVRSRGGR